MGSQAYDTGVASGAMEGYQEQAAKLREDFLRQAAEKRQERIVKEQQAREDAKEAAQQAREDKIRAAQAEQAASMFNMQQQSTGTLPTTEALPTPEGTLLFVPPTQKTLDKARAGWEKSAKNLYADNEGLVADERGNLIPRVTGEAASPAARPATMGPSLDELRGYVGADAARRPQAAPAGQPPVSGEKVGPGVPTNFGESVLHDTFNSTAPNGPLSIAAVGDYREDSRTLHNRALNKYKTSGPNSLSESERAILEDPQRAEASRYTAMKLDQYELAGKEQNLRIAELTQKVTAIQAERELLSQQIDQLKLREDIGTSPGRVTATNAAARAAAAGSDVQRLGSEETTRLATADSAVQGLDAMKAGLSSETKEIYDDASVIPTVPVSGVIDILAAPTQALEALRTMTAEFRENLRTFDDKIGPNMSDEAKAEAKRRFALRATDRLVAAFAPYAPSVLANRAGIDDVSRSLSNTVQDDVAAFAAEADVPISREIKQEGFWDRYWNGNVTRQAIGKTIPGVVVDTLSKEGFFEERNRLVGELATTAGKGLVSTFEQVTKAPDTERMYQLARERKNREAMEAAVKAKDEKKTRASEDQAAARKKAAELKNRARLDEGMRIFDRMSPQDKAAYRKKNPTGYPEEE
jgi:hypothetical protein